MNTRPFFACAAMVVFAAAPAYAVDDSNRDYAFNPPYGYNAFNIDIPPGDDRVTDIAVIPSGGGVLGGGIILAGYTTNATGSSAVLMRLTADGAVDNGFGTFGRVIFRVSNTDTTITSVAIDNGILVVGGGWSGGGFVARLSYNGNLDTTFGTNGINAHDAGSVVKDVAVQDLRVLGLIDDSGIIGVMALDLDGQLDGSFLDPHGLVGYSIVDLPGMDRAAAMAVRSDGEILVAGTNTNARSHMFVARMRRNGGLVSTPSVLPIDWCSSTSGADNAIATALAVDAAGRALVGGYGLMDSCPEGNSATLLAALGPGGNLDTTFSDDGLHSDRYFSTDLEDQEYLSDLTIEPDGRIVFAGASYTTDGAYHMSTARLLPSGDRDLSFAGDGTGQYDLGTGAMTEGYALAMQGNHPIVAGTVYNGSAGFDFLTIRLVSDRIFADGLQPRE